MDLELRNTFESVSIVTMCFNMGMKELDKVKNEKAPRGGYKEYYVESAKKLCRLFGNVIIYCDQECADVLREDKNCERAVIHAMSVEDIPTWKYLNAYVKAYERMERVLNWRDRLHYPEPMRYGCIVVRGESEANARYTALNQAKPYFCTMAIEENPFGTTYFYWIDAGCLTHEKYNMLWRGWEGDITYRPKGLRISLGIHPKLLKHWSIAKHLWSEKTFTFGFWPSPQAAAGIFGGSDEQLAAFEKKFEEIRNYLLTYRGWTTSDQGIITIMIRKFPKLFDIPAGLSGYQRMAYEVMNQEKSVTVW